MYNGIYICINNNSQLYSYLLCFKHLIIGGGIWVQIINLFWIIIWVITGLGGRVPRGWLTRGMVLKFCFVNFWEFTLFGRSYSQGMYRLWREVWQGTPIPVVTRPPGPQITHKKKRFSCGRTHWGILIPTPGDKASREVVYATKTSNLPKLSKKVE